MLKAIKVRTNPTSEQASLLNRQFGSVRFVYNAGLRIMSHRYKRHGESLNAKHDIKKLLPVAKKSRQYGWLKETDAMALQQACINLDKAFQRFFDPQQQAGYPRFKSKRGRQSIYHCVNVRHGDNWIKVPKLKAVDTAGVIGLDMGLSHLAIDSNGHKTANLSLPDDNDHTAMLFD